MTIDCRQTNSPALEGITLEMVVTRLSDTIGWDAMAAAIPIRCFRHDPSIKSSLKFLRRTPWARERVERLYLQQEKVADPNAAVGTGAPVPAGSAGQSD